MIAIFKSNPNKTEGELKEKFFRSKLMKELYRSKTKMYISKAMRSELDYLLHIFDNPDKYKWSTPIAHLIPRVPSFESFGDSCLHACGGFSLDLGFWWYIEWPEEI